MSTIKCDRYSEEVDQMCSVKKVFFEISQNSQEKTCARASSLIKLQAQANNFIKKETLAQYFPVNFAKLLRLEWKNFFLGSRLGTQKNRRLKTKVHVLDTTRNIAFCSLLPKFHLQLSFLMFFHQNFTLVA